MTFFFKSETEKHLNDVTEWSGEPPSEDNNLTRSLDSDWELLSDETEDEEEEDVDESSEDIFRLGM